jgi:hypothetical protein
MQEDLKSIRQRAERICLPFKVWGRLASTPESKIHQPNLSNWLDGEKTSESKVKRLLAVLRQVEDLVAAAKVRPDLSDEPNVRLALQTLAQIRANPAQAPWQYRGATASPEDGAEAVSIARSTLAGASESNP